MNSKKRILIVNPWIYDFAAYDMWLKPLALLYYASFLRSRGFDVDFIDCLDGVEKPGVKKMESVYGCRRFLKEEIDKPKALAFVQRIYSRYGITLGEFNARIDKLNTPDLILVGSMMTYWYGGVVDAINILKGRFPNTKVVLGGKYAEICSLHAKGKAGADYVIKAENLIQGANLLLNVMEEPADAYKERSLDDLPYPAFDMYDNLRYVCIATSVGCPFKCPYCYTPVSVLKFAQRKNDSIVDEIEYWNKEYGVENFAFYDDALNYQSEKRLKPILRDIISKKIKIYMHAPNALSARWMDSELAGLMFKAGFKTIRLGLETTDEKRMKDLGGKINKDEFEKCITFLKETGFQFDNLGAYILAGLPGQASKEIIEDIDYLLNLGVRPRIAEYSPIPGTAMFNEAKEISNFAIEDEPLFQNNSILPLQSDKFTLNDLNEIKSYLRQKVAEFRI